MSDPPRSAWYIKRETRDEKRSEEPELYMKKPELKKRLKNHSYTAKTHVINTGN